MYQIKKTSSLLSATLIALFLTGPFSLAGEGSKAGGGGDALVCEKDGVRTVQLLDRYEAEILRFSLDLGGEDLIAYEKINFALSRLALHDPLRAKNYREAGWQFYSELTRSANDPNAQTDVLLTSEPLNDIEDSLEVTKPEHCQIKQLVAQIKNPHPGEPKYWVQKELWNALSKDDQVATVLHEVIYKEMIEKGDLDSRNARYLNRLTFSDKLLKMNTKQYVESLRSMGIKDFAFQGKFFIPETASIQYHENGALKSAKISTIISTGDILDQLDRYLNDYFKEVTDRNAIEFLNSGEISSLRLYPFFNHYSLDFRKGSKVEFGKGAIYRGGILSSDGLGGFVIKGITKTNDIGTVAIRLQKDGIVTEISETGSFNEPLTSAQNAQLQSLLECVRTLSQKRGDAGITQSADRLSQVRARIRMDRSQFDVSEVVSSCQNDLLILPKKRMKKKEELKPLLASYSSEVRELVSQVVKRETVLCDTRELNVGAVLLLGAYLRLGGMSCLQSDGSRVIYSLTGAGFSLGIGFSALLEKRVYTPDGYHGTDAVGSGGLMAGVATGFHNNDTGNMSTRNFIGLGPELLDVNDIVTDYGIPVEAVGVGATIGYATSAAVGIRLSPNYGSYFQSHIQLLTKNILVQK